MTRTPLLLLLVSLWGIAAMESEASAQWWGPTYHSSTVGESHARGLGALIRDQGEANLLNAQAAGEYEQARSQYITNTVDAVQAYYDRKRVREAYYAHKKEEDKQALDRYLDRRGTITAITDNDVDPSTGQINWPALLRADQYADYRTQYEALFSKQFQSGLLTGDEFMKAQSISRDWRKQLGADRKQFDVNQVRSGIRFILGLDKKMTSS